MKIPGSSLSPESGVVFRLLFNFLKLWRNPNEWTGAVTLYQMWDLFPWCQGFSHRNRREREQSMPAGAEDTACAPTQLLHARVSSPSTQPQLLVLFQVVLSLGECGWRVKPGKIEVCTQVQDGGMRVSQSQPKGPPAPLTERRWSNKNHWDWEGDPARHHSEEKLAGEGEKRPKCHWPGEKDTI